MKNINYVSEDQYGMTISYEVEESMEIETTLIKEPEAIEAIKALGKALQKDSFMEVK